MFSGTGSISYEFASRGAEQVICVELNFKHCSFIKKTITELGFTQIHALRADVFKYVKGCNKKFDLIFADPPFDLDTIDTIPDAILKQNILNEDGILILEHSSRNDFTQHPLFYDTRSSGSVNFSFFKLKD